MTSQIRLIHWKDIEAQERVVKLRSLGYQVISDLPGVPLLLKELRQNPPLAVVIDLNRLPSQGRDMGLAIRHFKTTRYVPIVFVDGDTEKVKRIKELIPDASFTPWEEIGNVLAEAIANPPVSPIKPRSLFEGYAGRALTQKLGIKENMVVWLVSPPENINDLLVNLPDGVHLVERPGEMCHLILWFVRSKLDIANLMEEIVLWAAKSPVWIAWPKKASGIKTDLSQTVVREYGLTSGLVDYKICSIDDSWSGLLFRKKKLKKEFNNETI